MRRGMLLSVATAALVFGMGVAQSRADGPEVGANVGAVVPLSKFKDAVSGGVGGTFGLLGGYRWDVADNFAISLVGQPQFLFYPTPSNRVNDEVGSMFVITAGPKFTLITGDIETYITAQGGYYRDMSGPLSSDGIGFNAGGGVNYRITDEDSLGIYGRYDYASMDTGPRDDERLFVLAGLSYTHYFAPEPVVAEAPPPPPPPPAPRPAPPPPPLERRGG
jgi:hypothetical protein